jgi:glutathione S-transferase
MRLYDYAASANCYKDRFLLALLQREYERVPVDIFAGETLTDQYAALDPARETPVLELADGTVLTQSNAILWFLAEATPFLPEGRSSVARSSSGCSLSRSGS